VTDDMTFVVTWWWHLIAMLNCCVYTETEWLVTTVRKK